MGGGVILIGRSRFFNNSSMSLRLSSNLPLYFMVFGGRYVVHIKLHQLALYVL